MDFYVYLLVCSDGSFYTGHTDDLEHRLAAHEAGTLSRYTKARRPVRLVWCEAFATRDEAFWRERQVKGWSRAKKGALAAGDWQLLVNLARSRLQIESAARREARSS